MRPDALLLATTTAIPCASTQTPVCWPSDSARTCLSSVRQTTSRSRRQGLSGSLLSRLGPLGADVVEAVSRVAPDAVWDADELVVSGAPARRPAVIDIVRSAGAEI